MMFDQMLTHPPTLVKADGNRKQAPTFRAAVTPESMAARLRSSITEARCCSVFDFPEGRQLETFRTPPCCVQKDSSCLPSNPAHPPKQTTEEKMSTSCELKLERDEKLAMHEKFQRFSTVENYENFNGYFQKGTTMLLYQGTSNDFIKDAADGILIEKIEMSLFDTYHYAPVDRNLRLYGHHLQSLAKVFDSAGLRDNWILLKYQMPSSSKRLDCIVTGFDADGIENAVIIEMKDWGKCRLSDTACEMVDDRQGIPIEILHPSVQARQYCTFLENVDEGFWKGEQRHLSACTVLPEYDMQPDDALLDERYQPYLAQYPVFSHGEERKFSNFLQKRIAGMQGKSMGWKLLGNQQGINKKLMQQVSKLVGGAAGYVLLDEQKIAYDKIMAAVKHSLVSDEKKTIIIRGGPGTGKSVIALNLLADFRNDLHLDAHYATGSRAFRETLTKILGTRSKDYIRYFNSYSNAGWGSVPVIICDEAHRIRKTSNNRFVSVSQRLHKPQVDEILDAGQVCIFLLDDHQNIRPDEIGSTDYIRSHAQRKGCHSWEIALKAQFRCEGSVSYINWLDHTLAIHKTPNVIWDARKEAFDFRICDTPQQMENLLRAQMTNGNSARIVAGFCWPWSKTLDDAGHLATDVQIGDYERPWNARPEMKHLPEGVPSAYQWAKDSAGFQQIGCIYTVQGFEFDYIGVIFGEDLRYSIEEHAWVANPNASCDRMVRRAKDGFQELVRNTYKVLLTRGMKGCYVYFCDPDTREFFQSRLYEA